MSWFRHRGQSPQQQIQGTGAGGGSAEQPAPPSWRVLETPVPLTFTWASHFPDKLKLRKKFEVFPLQLQLSAVIDVKAQALSARASVKDTLVGGHLTLNTQSGEIEYRKRFEMQDNLALVLSGAASYRRERPPRVGLEVEVRHGAAILTQGTWAFKQKIRAKGPLHLQLVGGVDVPTPSAQYSLGGGQEGLRGLQVGEFHLTIQEANIVFEV